MPMCWLLSMLYIIEAEGFETGCFMLIHLSSNLRLSMNGDNALPLRNMLSNEAKFRDFVTLLSLEDWSKWH